MARTKQSPRSSGVTKKHSANKTATKQPFQHAHLSDDELFSLEPELITKDVILRLAYKYDERDIFDRVNAVTPNGIKGVNIIHCRLFYAMQVAAKASGRTVQDIRKEVAEARDKNGVTNEEQDAEMVDISVAEDEPFVTAAPVVRCSSTLAPNLQTHILFIFVGPHRELTTVHTALLPASTRAILEERARQHMVQQQPIYLIEDLPETFEVYRLFLYTGRIFSNNAQTDQDRADNGDDETHDDREWTRLAHMYIMGLDLDDEKFHNAVVDALVEKVAETVCVAAPAHLYANVNWLAHQDRYPTGLASEVYGQTPDGDKLRSLIVDLHVWKGQGTGIRAPHDDASGPMDFVQDVLRGLAEAGSELYAPDVPMPWDLDRCKYHVHAIATQCARSAVPVAAAGELGQSTLSTGQGLARDGHAAFVCAPCNKPFPSVSALGGHKASPGHKKNAKNWGAGAGQ